MSFYDDASLVFLPSGGAGKDTKAYSIKPTDGSGDFTFSRGGNLTATRVDSNGLIEKGRENLLYQSNQFDTTWTTDGASVTSGQSGYDGSSDAWKLLGTGGSFPRVQQNKSISGVSTFSVYAKAGNVNVLRLLTISGSNTDTKFQLTESGSILTQTGSERIESKITRLGSTDWYRCSITFNGSPTNFRIYPMSDSSTFAVNGEFIYIQDAQLEIGLVATEYIESGASTGLAGILEDSPRFDYSGGASCPSLLLEPSRTNLIQYSEYYNTYFTQQSVSVTDNARISPEGLQNASKLIPDSGTGGNRSLGINLTGLSGIHTFSVFAKAGEYGYVSLRMRNSTNNFVMFDLSDGSVHNTESSGNQYVANSAKSEDFGDGWYRLSASFDPSNSTTTGQLYASLSVGITGNETSGFDGDGTSGIFIYGMQFEAGSYPTSYIPNHSGGSVTREEDECTKTGISSLIGQTEGTIYCEFEYNGAADSGVFNRIIGLGTGVTQNRILLAKNDTTAELVAFAVTGGTTQVFQAIAGTSIIGHHKVAISYKANEYKVYLDGELEFTDTSASVPATTDVYIGTAEDGTTNNELGGIVKESIIYKEVLSEDNCKALTTL